VRLSFSALNSVGFYWYIYPVLTCMLVSEMWYKFDTKKQRAGEVQCSEQRGVSRGLKTEVLGDMEHSSSNLGWP